MDVRSDILPDRYVEVEPIGAGGMGEIFRARDEELGRRVAVKILSEPYAADNALRRRFKREALAAARVSGDPNIVTIFDVGEHRRRPFIVMEYLGGGSLEDRARKRVPCPAGQVLEWLEDAASALDAAHAAGIVHRDVKPGNLLLDNHGHVHVADFGIASAAGLDSFTKTGTILGTAGYLAPEQARGERATPATDLYALAVVAFELLAARRPFAADTPTAEAAAHIHAPVPSIHDANTSLPPQLDRVFTRALAKDPGARHETAGELVADLRAALDEAAGATALIDDAWPSLAPRGPSLAPATAARPTATRATAAPRRLERGGGGRWWIPFLIGVLVLGGAAVAYLATRDESGGTASATTAAPPPVRTFVKTVTQEARTVERTVTAAPPPPPTTQSTPTTTPTSAAPSGQSGAALNDAGFSKMRAGDYTGALPLLEQAVAKLQGTGALAEAYADYNLAYTRFALGRCDGVNELLQNSKRIQGERVEIKDLRERSKKACK
jgi:serine/threonine-protein kinase